MKIDLNLVRQSESDLKYKLSKFPDGQQSVTITSIGESWESHNVLIKSRLNSFLDLEIIISATQALRELKVNSISLYVPYFLGGRSDRKFEVGGSNYIKSVIAPIINLQGYKEVSVLDPHSDVIEACINNFKKIDNVSLVDEALSDWNRSNVSEHETGKKIVFVSSDAGALKKIYHLTESLTTSLPEYPIIIGNKHRDINGKITHTSVPDCEKYTNHDYFLVDDICDGGRTFVEVAKVIKNEIDKVNGSGRIFLVVTHGIFSAGFDELSKYFDGIWTTNSVSESSQFPSHRFGLIIQTNIF